MKRIILVIVCSFFLVSSAFAEEDPLTRLKDSTLEFFKPVTGKIIGVEGDKIEMDIGRKNEILPGMRLNILSEGEPFVHPVTGEMLGRVESMTGKVEVKDVREETSAGVLVEGNAKTGDKVRISGTKVKVLFCQDKKIDWYLADEYYRKLKETGRIEMIDTSLESSDETLVINEAKRLGAEAALVLTAKEADKGTQVMQKLLWVSDGSKFSEIDVKVDVSFAKELKFGEEFFTPHAGEALLMYNLPFGARFVATGDFDGDGKQEIMLSTGKDVRVFLPAVDLQFLWEVKGTASDDHLWIDSVDLNRNGKDEVVITLMRNDEVLSDIYELEGSEFKKLWEGKYFLRKIGTELIAQAYSRSDGFAGDIVALTWDGDYRLGEKIKLPGEVNIFDFAFIEGSDKEKLVFSYDEKGFLNLFDGKGIRVWRSSADTGGFLTTFKKETLNQFADREEWAVKDRIITRNREVLVVQRVPLAEMAKGIGYKSSRLKNYWWNGFSMDEGVLV
ncbi:MAG: VCBS repeat-containing protein, partial [Nitrospirota bacterium]|nr:VCBS repeat-containing protein [Nitrospirota bacterium]